MLKLYDPLEEMLSMKHFAHFNTSPLLYYASEMMELLGYEDPWEFRAILNRAMHVCKSMSIPVGEHFRQVFRYDRSGEMVNIDWKLSSLACYLLVINADPVNPIVARAQLYVLMKR